MDKHDGIKSIQLSYHKFIMTYRTVDAHSWLVINACEPANCFSSHPLNKKIMECFCVSM